MLQRCALLLTLLIAACGEAPETDLRLTTIESPAAVGLSLRELPPSVLKSIGLSYGLAVVRADGKAEKAGLRMGDVVYGVNQQRLHSIEEFNKLIAEAQKGQTLALLVRRGEAALYVPVEVG